MHQINGLPDHSGDIRQIIIPVANVHQWNIVLCMLENDGYNWTTKTKSVGQVYDPERVNALVLISKHPSFPVGIYSSQVDGAYVILHRIHLVNYEDFIRMNKEDRSDELIDALDKLEIKLSQTQFTN